MKFIRTVTALAASGGLAMFASAAAVTPSASAATVTQISIPNVAITSMNTVKIKAGLHYYDPSGSYSWVIKTSTNVSDYSTSSLGWIDWSVYTGWGFYADWYPGINPLGTYHAYPDTSSTNSGPENTATFYVRLGSKLSISAVRSGQYVTIGAHAGYYNDNLDGYYGRGGWTDWRGRAVAIQVWTGKAWATVKTLTTNSRGMASLKISSPSVRSWRVADGSTSLIWGATSATIRK
jgi:hypothetical protein